MLAMRPTATDAFACWLVLAAIVIAYEVLALATGGTTLSEAVWGWAEWLPLLETVVGLGMLFLWLHLFRHPWLVAAWDYVIAN